MNKNSSIFGSRTESGRRCEFRSGRICEWTYEGGRKEIKPSVL